MSRFEILGFGMTVVNVVEADEGFCAAHYPFYRAVGVGPEIVSLDDAKRDRIAAIRDHFEAVVAAIKADAAPYELDSWPIQRAEYVAWLMDPASPTPYVSGLAAGRGITLQDLMGKIGTKVAGLSTIQGTQHRLEKLVESATSIAEVEAVTW